MKKRERQQIILDVVNATNITGQEQLVDILLDRGIPATQASVSRDLDELSVIKINGRYVRTSPSVATTPYGTVSVMASGDNLIVVRCGSGLASALAVRIDSANINDVAGTIAGDDTIFVAVSEIRSRKKIIRRLKELFDV